MKHDLPVVAADVRAIDVGYYNTKYTKGRVRSGDSSTIEVASFPSVAPSVTPTQVSIGEGSAAGGVVIGVEGVDFFVGPDATTQASASEPRPVSEDYSQNPRYHALNLGALDSMAEHDGAGMDYIIRTLVVGLPLTTFLTYKDKVTNKLRGVHEIKRTGGPVRRRIVVENVEVIVQPQGALLNRAVGNTRALVGLSVVVDAGGGTLDWFAAVDRKPNWARSGSYPKAMLHCAQAVADAINKNWKDQIDVMFEIDAALRTGAATFRVGAKEFNIADYQPAVDLVLGESVSRMLASTGSLENARQILFVGGGAPLFHGYMARRYPDLAGAMVIEPDPMFANVSGFHLIGEMSRSSRRGA